MRIGFYATEGYYVDHLASIWLALPSQARGPFFCGPKALDSARRRGIPPKSVIQVSGERNATAKQMVKHHSGPVLTASWSNFRTVVKSGLPSPTIPHGPGGLGTNNNVWTEAANKIDVMLVPAEYGQVGLDGVNTVVINGQPKLDRWFGHKPKNSSPVLALSFRWRDSQAAIDHYRPFIAEIKKQADKAGVRLLGHGHPLKFSSTFQPMWNAHGIESTPHFEEVLQRADVYAADCSSSSFEFVALDRPVIFLWDPKYKDFNWGPRFTMQEAGLTNYEPLKLIEEALVAYEDPIDIRESRREVKEVMYGDFQGQASRNAAKVLLDFYG